MNNECLVQYENKVVSILAHIMAEQAEKGRGAIKTAPSTDYLRLAKQILFFLESHEIGDEVQEKTTIHPEFEGGKGITQRRSQLELADSAPASTSTCATTNTLVHAFAEDPDVANNKESDPSRGLLKAQGSQGSCNRGQQGRRLY